MESPSEKEYVLNRGASIVADHFRNKIMDNFRGGKVAVLVKHLGEMLYFMDCDENGYPKRDSFRTIESLGLLPFLESGEEALLEATTFTEYTIVLKRPLVMTKLPDLEEFYGYKMIVFLWEGEIIDSKKVKLEELDIKHLMKLAQEAIKKREGLIIDLVDKNKKIK